MSQHTIYLIGTGFEGCGGFSKKAMDAIAAAEVITGHQRYLDLVQEFPGEKRELGDLSLLLEFLQTTDKRVVVLCSGDPNFFGIARFLLRNLPKERLEIMPNVTSVQYAFARIREPWDDAVFVSVHGRELGRAIDRIIAAEKVAILTDTTNTPATIARELIARGAEGYDAWLCENLGQPNENLIKTDMKGLLDIAAAPLNILILIKAWEPNLTHYPLMGIEDEEFATAKKLITKQEVRAVTLAKLKLMDDLVMWDIGAGSGSVSIEASNLIPNGRIFAVEQNAQYLVFLRDNLKKFVASNVKLVEGSAPDALDDLPDPDRVFIGGSGGMLEEIIDTVDRRLKPGGLLVLNAVTLDTLTKAVEMLENNGCTVEVTCVNIAKTRGLSEFKLFEAHNPVYIIAAWKGSE
jgi:precorrin-6Y C5,15-methyltransferase (decarboxylating)